MALVLIPLAAEPVLGKLSALAAKYGADKAPQVNNYTTGYEYFLSPIKDSATAICEIGVKQGASMKMFADYFLNAKIYGIDIRDTKHLDSDRIHTFVANQARREDLRAFTERHPATFDLVLDDGGHRMDQQQISFAFLFQKIKPGGYYIIEDVHSSLLEKYGQKPDGSNTTLTMIDHFIRTGKIESAYMTAEEKDYLNKNILYANLLSINQGRRAQPIACLFKKK